MTVDLTFNAPVDLSVGTVRISGADGEVTTWVATPDDRMFSGKVAPGYYIADISPAGVPPQSVVFQVHPDTSNVVTTPPFSSLQASSGDTTFLNVDSRSAAVNALFDAGANASSVISHSAVARAPDRVADDANSTASVKVPCEAFRRRLSVGLATERPDLEGGFGPFTGRANIELSENRLELAVSGADDWSPRSGERVRLSATIEDVRIEYLMLPMYRGGVRVTILPSAMSKNDVELQVLPSDPRLRALVRSLVAGTPDEAEAVGKLINASQQSADTVIDPWEAMLWALLAIRFPDSLPTITDEQMDALMRLAPWAADSYVIKARHLFYTTNGAAGAAEQALGLLETALNLTAPYFGYANQLFAELIEPLYDHFKGEEGSRAAAIRGRWLGEQRLQSNAVGSFSWLQWDEERRSTTGTLVPDYRPSGLLDDSETALFVGEIVGSSFRLDPTQSLLPAKESSLPDSSIIFDTPPDACPAAHRVPGPSNDPNLGRFGGQDARQGYRLTTSFAPTADTEVVAVTMMVVADSSTQIPAGEVAWFCLHPSFHPQWVKVLFGNDRAVLSVQAWGGFTVGVWLPLSAVELENDLAKLPDAPDTIRNR